jgi:hypothetical protein
MRHLLPALLFYCPLACVHVPTDAPTRDRQQTTEPQNGQNPEYQTSDPHLNSDVTPQKPDEPKQEEQPARVITPVWQALLEGPSEPLIAALDAADENELKLLLPASEGAAQQAVMLRLARIQLHRGAVAQLPSEVPPGLLAALSEAQKLKQAFGVSKPGRIGLLLPQDRPWGDVLHKAFLLGLGETELEVVLRSSQNPEQGMRELIIDEQVSLVICGPFIKRARRAAVVAAQFSLPLISLGRSDELAALGSTIFQVGLSNEAQIKHLVAGAMEQRGYQRFAVLFPRTVSGWRAASYFTAEVEKRGGSVTKTQPYPRGETTFTGFVTGMVGRNSVALKNNPKYRHCVAGIDKKLKGLRKKRKVESCRDHTPPQVDFDAIFIPDTVATVRQIMPFIELADMVPNLNDRVLWRTRKATDNKELIATPILGMRQLNSQYFANRSRTDVEGSLFVDAYYPYDSERSMPGLYARQFRKTFKRPPDLLETLAHDTGLLVAHLAGEQRLSGRSIAVRALSELNEFEAVTGIWSMGKDGQVERPLYLLSIHKRRIVTEAARLEALNSKQKKRKSRRR